MVIAGPTGSELKDSNERVVESGKSATAKAESKSRIGYWLALFFLFVLPLMMVSPSWIPPWVGRAAAVSSFTFFATIAVFWRGLSPKSKMIRGGRLSESRFDNVRPKIERGMRLLVVAFGFLLSFYVALPLALDLFHLAGGEKPTTITAVVKYKSVPLGGIWFVHQSVRFTRDAVSYSLFYSWKPLQVGSSYQFTLLPRSREILDFHESGG